MYYLITVLLITSILSLALACHYRVKYLESVQTSMEQVHDLQNQLNERENDKPGPKVQTFKEKVQMARNVLIPQTRWKPGRAIEEVAHDQGIADALDWLERNHTKVELNSRHVR